MNWVLDVEKENTEYEKCVFIDEAGFKKGRTYQRSGFQRLRCKHFNVGHHCGGGDCKQFSEKALSSNFIKKAENAKWRRAFSRQNRDTSTSFLSLYGNCYGCSRKNDIRGRIFITDNYSIHHSSIAKDLRKS